jgi:hypothetical protein
MLRDYRKVALVVVPLLLAAGFVEHDGIAIALSAAGLAVALAALGVTFWSRRKPR